MYLVQCIISRHLFLCVTKSFQTFHPHEIINSYTINIIIKQVYETFLMWHNKNCTILKLHAEKISGFQQNEKFEPEKIWAVQDTASQDMHGPQIAG